MNNILVVIPARGGSKSIPRKNLRSLSGKPLIYYSIKTSLASKYNLDVYVTSEDDEILSISQQIGAKIVKRQSKYAGDVTTLDPVIYDAYKKIKKIENKSYSLIITLQPTSPLLKVSSLDSAIKMMLEDDTIDTVISASDDTHLTWKKEKGAFIPNYEKRVNRQYLTPIFRETGGFLITRSKIITENSRIGKSVKLYLLNEGENIDVDVYEDWNLCEYYLQRKKILFVVSGHKEIGLGHVYNTLLIANDILNHRILFLVDNKSQLAYDKISSNNYAVFMQTRSNIISDIKNIQPDIVINDRLDTGVPYMEALKNLGVKVINFEDLGQGAKEADLVLNAMYPENEILLNHYFGHKYFILRDEFMLSRPNVTSEEVNSVLLTFGGVDPNNYTLKVLKSIYPYCHKNHISISVVAGFGYQYYETLDKFDGISVYINAANISEHMNRADLIFTSSGRSIYEVASLRVPAIILAQNERELTHFFASEEFGFTNLGLGCNISRDEILSVFVGLVNNFKARKYMSNLMSKSDLRSGRKRVMKLIKDIVEGI
ncbi:MAG: acylneuraminate cytidylyltransferase [Colwellia sp.]|nr:acylneuraminate cytidylyltransferase [Colwellia sp.]